jgi:hypothetical protein
MGRRRTAEEYNQTAEENGWVRGAHEEEDSIQQTKGKPTGRYKLNQQGALSLSLPLALNQPTPGKLTTIQ